MPAPGAGVGGAPGRAVRAGQGWRLVGGAEASEAERAAIARYFLSKRNMLGAFAGDAAMRMRVLGARMAPGQLAAALGPDGAVLGAVGYRIDGRSPFTPDPAAFRAAFGPVAGTARALATGAVLRRGRADALHIEGFSVERVARGRGIGTALLGWVLAETRRHGRARWRAEVPEASEAAIRLYRAAGGRRVRRIWLGPLGPALGLPPLALYEGAP